MILNVLGMANIYRCRPSTLLELSGYEAYCFDEACAYIRMKMEDGEKPQFVNDKVKNKHFKSASEMYKALGVINGVGVKEKR